MMDAPGTSAVVVTTAVVTVSLLYCARSLLSPARKPVLANPLRNVEALAEGEGAPEYRPDHFPGARDVSTPVGLLSISPKTK